MKRRTWGAAVLPAVALTAALMAALAGCSSSGGGPHSSGPVLPSSPATPPSTPASTPVSTPAPPTSSAPLSPFEADPSVKVMRAWAAQAARTVNTGQDNSAALKALMTPFFSGTMGNILGDDAKLKLLYPGPIPLQPVALSVLNSTQRIVKVCDVTQGFALNRKTNQPAAARTVVPAFAYTRLVSGKWLMDDLTRGSGFTCTGVKVAEPTW